MAEETIIESIKNDEWVAMLQGRRLVSIPNRNENGDIDVNQPIVVVEVDWHCPVCGKIMGEMKNYPLYVGKDTYYVSGWTSPCGHKCTYSDLKPKSVLPKYYQHNSNLD